MQHLNPNNDLYAIKLKNAIEPDIFEYLLKFIHFRKKEHILRQKTKQNADNMLIGEILAKVAIKKTFGIDISKQEFVCNEYGKPYLLNYPDVHFNISHSGQYVACAVSDKPVGIDIQKISEYNPAVAKRVCSVQELKCIESSTDKSSEFIKLWTQKEAVIKMHGTGIANTDIKNCLNNENTQSQKIDDYWLSIAEQQ